LGNQAKSFQPIYTLFDSFGVRFYRTYCLLINLPNYRFV
jgi:hypothetical protein